MMEDVQTRELWWTEVFELASDRAERANLIADPARQKQIEAMRGALLAVMRRAGDPLAEAFAARENKTLAPALLGKLNAEYRKATKRNQHADNP